MLWLICRNFTLFPKTADLIQTRRPYVSAMEDLGYFLWFWIHPLISPKTLPIRMTQLQPQHLTWRWRHRSGRTSWQVEKARNFLGRYFISLCASQPLVLSFSRKRSQSFRKVLCVSFWSSFIDTLNHLFGGFMIKNSYQCCVWWISNVIRQKDYK